MRKDEGKLMTRFLKEKGSFSAWKKNFKRHYGKNCDIINRWFNDVSLKDSIGSGFFFHDTAEGCEYWFNLERDWRMDMTFGLLCSKITEV